MSDRTDPRVDDYVNRLPGWQQGICREVRKIAHAADPEIEETIKFGDRPYFVCDGNVCALLAAKKHVCVFHYDGAIVPDPQGIITSGHGNETARQISMVEGGKVEAEPLRRMLAQIAANNRAGGWRKLKQDAKGAKG